MVFNSPFPELVIPGCSLSEHVLERASSRGENVALVDGPTGRELTYRDVLRQSQAVAASLQSRLRPGQVVALMLPNAPEFAVLLHGSLLAGLVVTTISPAYTREEVSRQLSHSEAKMLITVGTLAERAQVAAAGTKVESVFVLGEPFSGARSGSELYAGVGWEPRAVEPNQTAALLYSSGTTGVSKGIMLTHYNLVANVEQIITVTQLHQDDTLMAVLPFFHIFGMQVLVNCGLRVGATLVTMPRFDLEEFLTLHETYGVTRSFLTPPILVELAKHPLIDNYDLSQLKQIFSGAAPLSAELALEVSERIGCEVVQGFGMTELSGASHGTPPGGFRPGSSGPTVSNTATRIVDPATQRELGVDVDGEICIKGPQVMAGYLNDETATRAVIDTDGWLHTGDLGHVDADGYLYVVDRLKELIKYKGFQVSPAELEALLITHPQIADAAVVGQPDLEAGEIPAAHVVLKPGADLTADEVCQFVAEHVAHYKQIRTVFFTETIPKSPAGKILRRMLRPGDT